MKFDVTEMPDRKPVQFPLLCGNQFERRQRRGPRLLWKLWKSKTVQMQMRTQIDSMLKTLKKQKQLGTTEAQAVEIVNTRNPPN